MPPRDCIVQLEMPENSNTVAQITPAAHTVENLTENQAIASDPIKSDEMHNPIQPITNLTGVAATGFIAKELVSLRPVVQAAGLKKE